MNVYTIHDLTAGFYLPPFTAPNDGMAERMFIGSLGDSFHFRSQFSLWRIGVFSDESGTITPHDANHLVLQGNSVHASLDPRPRPLSADQTEGTPS